MSNPYCKANCLPGYADQEASLRATASKPAYAGSTVGLYPYIDSGLPQTGWYPPRDGTPDMTSPYAVYKKPLTEKYTYMCTRTDDIKQFNPNAPWLYRDYGPIRSTFDDLVNSVRVCGSDISEQAHNAHVSPMGACGHPFYEMYTNETASLYVVLPMADDENYIIRCLPVQCKMFHPDDFGFSTILANANRYRLCGTDMGCTCT